MAGGDPGDRTEPRNINIHYDCKATRAQMEGFKSLVQWLFEASIFPVPELLTEFRVVAKGQIPVYVDGTLQAPDKSSHPYSTEMLGAAMIIETDDTPVGIIFIDETIVQLLTPQVYFVATALSVTIEEIIHMVLYSIHRDHRGHVSFSKEQFPCRADLLNLCSRMHDEYSVTRWKAEILARKFQAVFEYGKPIAPLLNQAAMDLKNTIEQAVTGRVSIEGSHRHFSETLYQGILDPLARNTGYHDANPDADHSTASPEDSWFYPHIEPYWREIHVQLERSVKSKFVETEDALSEIASTLEAFMKLLGITVKQSKDSECWVDFTTAFFDLVGE